MGSILGFPIMEIAASSWNLGRFRFLQGLGVRALVGLGSGLLNVFGFRCS